MLCRFKIHFAGKEFLLDYDSQQTKTPTIFSSILADTDFSDFVSSLDRDGFGSQVFVDGLCKRLMYP